MSLWESRPHESSIGHVTGRSQFIDDRPMMGNELWVGVVGAPVNAGHIEEIDSSLALNVAGVVAVFTAEDLAHNLWGTIKHDQPILVESEIGYIDEPVCLVAAESLQALEQAKKLVRIKVKQSQSLTFDQSIKNKDFFYQAVPFIKGDANVVISAAPFVLNGEFDLGGQEHFYLESQAAVAYPNESDQIEVHSSSQHPTETQNIVAEALGLDANKVVCIVKRMGGAFGGKESQAAPIAAMAALVAFKTGRPARLVLTKDQDMQVTGKRHPFHTKYKVGFDRSGRILALQAELYADGGAYTDLSPSILDRALFHIDGAYYLPTCDLKGFVCKTNSHSNTAFRGFGGPQGTATIETIIEDIAQVLKIDSFEVRKINCYGTGDRNVTPYGQKVEPNPLPTLFHKISGSSKYQDLRKEVDEFNGKRNGKVKGLACTAVKFGIAFTAKFLNQANALVHVLRDGSVQVATGATEMGQGVYTKIQQTVALTLDVPFDKVQVLSTSTDKNANTSPTAASSGADMNCAAAQLACLAIKARLEKLRQENPLVSSWIELVNLAYVERISLSEQAHYKTEGIGFDKATGQGTPFKYFTNGVAVSLVEVDEFTGELKILRSDILMDLGRPMNPLIDRGQVVGGFIQGVGWVTTEKLYYNDQGRLLSHSPTTYKIPNIQDVPRVFNVEFLENTPNPHNEFGSKAVGEPPLLLGSSVFCAVKNAISYRSAKATFDFHQPATHENILMTLAAVKGHMIEGHS